MDPLFPSTYYHLCIRITIAYVLPSLQMSQNRVSICFMSSCQIENLFCPGIIQFDSKQASIYRKDTYDYEVEQKNNLFVGLEFLLILDEYLNFIIFIPSIFSYTINRRVNNKQASGQNRRRLLIRRTEIRLLTPTPCLRMGVQTTLCHIQECCQLSQWPIQTRHQVSTAPKYTTPKLQICHNFPIIWYEQRKLVCYAG